MERLASTQVAVARQRKREILLSHGIPAASRAAARILVMPRLLTEFSARQWVAEGSDELPNYGFAARPRRAQNWKTASTPA